MSNYRPEISALWEDLKQLTRNVVEAMNRDAELSPRTGRLECRFADNDTIIVSKQSAPKMTVAIVLRAAALDVHTRLVVSGAGSTERETRETLTIKVDEGESPLRSAKGDVFTVDQAVFYLLRPFLHLGSEKA